MAKKEFRGGGRSTKYFTWLGMALQKKVSKVFLGWVSQVGQQLNGTVEVGWEQVNHGQ